MRGAALALAGLLGAAGLTLAASLAAAQDAVAPPAPGVPAGDAERGGDVYRANCALCHGASLYDGQFAPSLKGAQFRRTWGQAGPAALLAFVKRVMPPGQEGMLPDQDYADVVAYIVQANAAPPAP